MVDAEVAEGGDVELGSGSSLRRSTANGLCLILTLAPAVIHTTGPCASGHWSLCAP